MNGPTFASPRQAAAPPAPPAPTPRPAPARPAVKPAARPDVEAGNGLRVLTYLRLHWLLILFWGSLLGGGLAYAAWELLASKYESNAILHVLSAPTVIAAQGNRDQARTDFTTYMKTTATLIKSEFVLNAALRDLKDVPTIRAQKDPIKYLDEEILVTWKDGSEVILISFKGHHPSDVKKIVDAVQGAFMSEWVMKDVQEKRNIMLKLKDIKQEVATSLEKHMTKPAVPAPAPLGGAVLPAGAAVPAPFPVPGEGQPLPPRAGKALAASTDEKLLSLNPQLIISKLAQYEVEVEKLPPLMEDAKRRMAAAQARIKALEKAPPSPANVLAVEKEEEVAQAVNKAKRLKHQYELAKGFGDANAPKVVALRENWHAEEKNAEKLKKDKLFALEDGRRSAEADKLILDGQEADRTLRRLSEQFAVAQSQLTKYEKLCLAIKPQQVAQAGFREEKDIAGYNPADTALRTEDGVFQALVRQYLMTKMELESPERVRILQKGSNPTQKDMKKQIIATSAAGLLGFALLGLGVVAFETMTRRVSSLADLKTAGPAPVVGVIPCLPNEAMGKDPARRAAANEAIDKLRSYVAQSWLTRGATTVAVSSATGDEGKAFTAFGLASSLSQSGYRTLLVDFDLRSPSMHTYAGLPNSNGVCEILRGEAEVRKSVQSLPSGLDLVPAGRWSDEARKAAVGGKLDALLARLKEPYDCVVLHGHALLTVAESVEVARRCEVVLVCALYRETKTPLLRKATDRVAAMEVPFSGVVYVGASEQEALC